MDAKYNSLRNYKHLLYAGSMPVQLIEHLFSPTLPVFTPTLHTCSACKTPCTLPVCPCWSLCQECPDLTCRSFSRPSPHLFNTCVQGAHQVPGAVLGTGDCVFLCPGNHRHGADLSPLRSLLPTLCPSSEPPEHPLPPST